MTNPLPAESMARITALHRWTLNPTDGVEGLTKVLAVMTDDELIYTTAIYRAGEPVGRIAWVEYAKRKKYFDFEVKLIPVSPSQLRLVFESQGAAIHQNPILDVKVPS